VVNTIRLAVIVVGNSGDNTAAAGVEFQSPIGIIIKELAGAGGILLLHELPGGVVNPLGNLVLRVGEFDEAAIGVEFVSSGLAISIGGS
jgi:hypothetical protein